MCNSIQKYWYVSLFSDKELTQKVNSVSLYVDYSKTPHKATIDKNNSTTGILFESINKSKRSSKITLYKENDQYQFYKLVKLGKTYYFKLPYYNTINFERVNSDMYGNPRYVCHFLDFFGDGEKATFGEALTRAKKIGGQKYGGKNYGGGIVFQSYNTTTDERNIKALRK